MAETIEEALAEAERERFVVVNTFQTPEGWKVYMRCLTSTQSGKGEGPTLAAALQAALAATHSAPAYSSNAGAWSPPPGPGKIVTLAPEGGAGEEDLF